MKKRTIILLVSVVLLSIAGFVTWKNRPVPVEIDLALSGTDGLRVAGIVAADGVTHDFSGILPTNITVKARSFDYTIRMTEAGGALNSKCTVSGERSISSGTTEDFGGLEGHYSQEWGGKRASVTRVGGLY